VLGRVDTHYLNFLNGSVKMSRVTLVVSGCPDPWTPLASYVEGLDPWLTKLGSGLLGQLYAGVPDPWLAMLGAGPLNPLANYAGVGPWTPS